MRLTPGTGFTTLHCYIISNRKDLPVKNTLAYWAHSKVTKKMKYEYDPCLLKKSRIFEYFRGVVGSKNQMCKVTLRKIVIP